MSALRVTAGALALAAAICAWQLFVPPIVGQTDNGDFRRHLAPAGLAYPEGWDAARRRSGFCREFLLRAPRLHNHTGDPRDDVYASSEVLLLWAARGVNALVSRNGRFDVVAAGIVHAVVMLAGLGLVLRAAGRVLSPPAHVLLAALLVLAFTDVAYVAWFNSLYGEPASIAFFMLAMGVALAAATAPPSLRLLAAFLAVVFLFATAKAQNIGLVIPAALLGARLAARLTRRRGLGLAACAALFLTAPVLLATVSTRPLRQSSLFMCVFTGLLRNSPEPEADLRELGLDPALMRYVGMNYFLDPKSPHLDPEFKKAFFDRTSLGRVWLHYLRHPDRFWRVMVVGGTRAFQLRYDYMGNYERGAGFPPGAKSPSFALWSGGHTRLQSSLVVLAAAAAAFTGLVVACWRRDPAGRTVFEALLLLPAIAAVQFMTVMLGEGPWTANRQLLLMNVAFDAMAIAGVVIVAEAARRRLRGPVTFVTPGP